MNLVKGHMPDFSQGEDFLAGVHQTMRRRARRNGIVAGAVSSVAAVLLFVFALGQLQTQIDNDLWNNYLWSIEASTWENVAEVEMWEEAYIASLLEEENLDELLDEVLLYYDDANWYETIELEEN